MHSAFLMETWLLELQQIKNYLFNNIFNFIYKYHTLGGCTQCALNTNQVATHIIPILSTLVSNLLPIVKY